MGKPILPHESARSTRIDGRGLINSVHDPEVSIAASNVLAQKKSVPVQKPVQFHTIQQRYSYLKGKETV